MKQDKFQTPIYVIRAEDVLIHNSFDADHCYFDIYIFSFLSVRTL